METNKIGIHIAYKNSIISHYHQSIKVILQKPPPKTPLVRNTSSLFKFASRDGKSKWMDCSWCCFFVHRKTTLFEDSKIISYGTTSSHLWFTPIYIAQSLGPSKSSPGTWLSWPVISPIALLWILLSSLPASKPTKSGQSSLWSWIHDSMHRFMGWLLYLDLHSSLCLPKS